LNEFDLARLERTKRRIVTDPNRISAEGPSRNPAHCHDYGPDKPLHTPERRAAIRAAVEKIGERFNASHMG
jgi:hypothetical protein